MEFNAMLKEDRRRCILQFLEGSSGRTGSLPFLVMVLDMTGHRISSKDVAEELSWLEQNRLVTLDAPGGVVVATLTRRGTDVAQDRLRVAGVKRPEVA
ncbi:MAG: ArsR family transcriptional regulator [Magnetococcales bacterium]|nr:ArsR family transcriptional regulator [Magnetococcales bacterium]